MVDKIEAVNEYFSKTHSITRYPDTTWLIQKNIL